MIKSKKVCLWVRSNLHPWCKWTAFNWTTPQTCLGLCQHSSPNLYVYIGPVVEIKLKKCVMKNMDTSHSWQTIPFKKKADTLAPVKLDRRSLKQYLPSSIILIYAGFFQKFFFFFLSTEVANCTNFDTFIQLRRNSNMTLQILRIQLLSDYILRHFQVPLQMLMNAQNVSWGPVHLNAPTIPIWSL